MTFVVDQGRKLIAVKKDALRNGVPPFAKGISGSSVVFPHTDLVAMYLRKQEDLEIPWPINCYYDWPCPPHLTPDPHQTDLFAPHMAYSHRCMVLGGMGSQKTAATLWSLDWVMKMQHVNRVMIVGTKSTIDNAWLSDMHLFTPGRFEYSVLGTGSEHKATMAKKSHQVMLTTHDSLRSMYYTNEELKDIRRNRMQRNPTKELWESAPPWDLIIVDEFTYFRTHSASRTEIMTRIARDNPQTRLWFLSGSPIPNKPTDIYAPARMICPDRVPKYFTHFRDMVMNQISQYKWVPKKGATELIYSMIGDYAVRVDTNDVVDKPPCLHRTKAVHATQQQTDMATELINEAAVMLENGEEITAANAAVLNNKLIQIYSGAVKTEKIDEKTGKKIATWRAIPTPKYKALKQLREKTEGPIIVFAPFRANLVYLTKWAKKNGYKSAVINGSVGRTKRGKIFKKVQNNEVDFLFSIADAMAHGVTLTRSNVVLWWSPLPSMNNDIYDQANHRHDRRGQTRTCYVLHFLGSKEEDILLKGVRGKQKQQKAFLEIMRQRDLRFVS
jgi:SNF2 family DNA or RNA helicase